MSTPTNILADRFPFTGVCPFCRTSQKVHEESGLCAGCLPHARAGWVPDHIARRAAAEAPKPTPKPQRPKRERRCSGCRYTVAGWQPCSYHFQQQYNHWAH